MKPLFAILAFAGAYLCIGALLYLSARAGQSAQGPSVFAMPLIGVALTAMPACVAFAAGVLLWGRTIPVKRCIVCGLSVAAGVACVSSPMSDVAPASAFYMVTNAAFAAIIVICLCLPRIARPSTTIAGQRQGSPP